MGVALFNRVRYTLRVKDYPEMIIQEPLGWQDDNIIFKRHSVYDGIFAVFSASLTFVGDAVDYINNVISIYGDNVDIQLIKDIRNPYTDMWERAYDYPPFLDLELKRESKKGLDVPLKNGGLESLLKARSSTSVEIERPTSLDGVSISPLVTKTFSTEGVRIFLRSTFQIEDGQNTARLEFHTEAGSDAVINVNFPLKTDQNNHGDNALSTRPNTMTFESDYSLNQMFFYSETTRILKLQGHYSFKMNVQQEDIDACFGGIYLMHFKDGLDFNVKDSDLLFNIPDKETLFALHNSTEAFTINHTKTLEQGESLGIIFKLNTYLGGPGDAFINVNCEILDDDFSIEEDSGHEKTSAKSILAYDLGNQLAKIITGKDNAFYSEVLGTTDKGYAVNGTRSLRAFSHGMWIRGYDLEPKSEDNKYQPFKTSFKDYANHLKAIENIGIGIENIGYRSRIRVEDRSYFYNLNTTVKLPFEAQDLELEYSKEDRFSNIEIGFEKGWINEEALGLDEPISKASYKTPLKHLSKTFKMLSKYIGSLYAPEFIRRFQKENYPTRDHKNDKQIFCFDLKKENGELVEKTALDYFDQAPTGVFNAENAKRLIFSPLNILKRHGWYLRACLTNFSNDTIDFIESESNSNLTTILDGEILQENKGVKIDSLQRPRFKSEIVKFKHDVSYELLKHIQGHTEINGVLIPNMYGVFEYKYKGEIRKGFLEKLNPEKGEFELKTVFR